jgi:hypothetical protein
MRATGRVTAGLQFLELIVERITDAALQQSRDVLVELAILPPQSGNRHGRGRLDVLQMDDDLIEGRFPAQWPLLAFWPASHHGRHVTPL